MGWSAFAQQGQLVLRTAFTWLLPACCIRCEVSLPNGLPHVRPSQWLGKSDEDITNPPSDGQPNLFLCAACLRSLPWLPHAKPSALHAPLPPPQTPSSATAPHGPFLYAVFRLERDMQHWIWALKYQGRTQLAPMLGYCLALSPLTAHLLAWADCIAPVPLHWRKLSERGFNQSLLLAYHWQKALYKQQSFPIPKVSPNQSVARLTPKVLQRQRYTKQQMRLNARERLKNVCNAFAVPMGKELAQIAEKRWLLIDDVSTTGATGRACAKALKHAGAAEVRMLTLAWAPLNREGRQKRAPWSGGGEHGNLRIR